DVWVLIQDFAGGVDPAVQKIADCFDPSAKGADHMFPSFVGFWRSGSRVVPASFTKALTRSSTVFAMVRLWSSSPRKRVNSAWLSDPVSSVCNVTSVLLR